MRGEADWVNWREYGGDISLVVHISHISLCVVESVVVVVVMEVMEVGMLAPTLLQQSSP